MELLRCIGNKKATNIRLKKKNFETLLVEMSFAVVFIFYQTLCATRRCGYLGAEKIMYFKYIFGCTDHTYQYHVPDK